ncbi:hypothetical protein LBWT_48780 [Leptolyngbya boryana IAM M-101]|nr:hypothetical protein LBWT_48780 [Leptolyngbya boryana IAM M-101]BAS65257.1 hypothetical protein LBDG_48780 [Leptolyngbya boryana dg5]
MVEIEFEGRREFHIAVQRLVQERGFFYRTSELVESGDWLGFALRKLFHSVSIKERSPGWMFDYAE